MAGVDIVHIPYKGNGPAMNDLIGGHIPMIFDSLPTVVNASKGGLVRVLALTGLKRSSLLPDVPTLDESGVKGSMYRHGSASICRRRTTRRFTKSW
jgi:tripartite-type tricarboxylate transporter receptor subunit TctC